MLKETMATIPSHLLANQHLIVAPRFMKILDPDTTVSSTINSDAKNPVH